MSYTHHQSIRPTMLLQNRIPPPQSPQKGMLCFQISGNLLPRSVATPQQSSTFFAAYTTRNTPSRIEQVGMWLQVCAAPAHGHGLTDPYPCPSYRSPEPFLQPASRASSQADSLSPQSLEIHAESQSLLPFFSQINMLVAGQGSSVCSSPGSVSWHHRPGKEQPAGSRERLSAAASSLYLDLLCHPPMHPHKRAVPHPGGILLISSALDAGLPLGTLSLSCLYLSPQKSHPHFCVLQTCAQQSSNAASSVRAR